MVALRPPCPHCNAPASADDSRRGQNMSCPSCGRVSLPPSPGSTTSQEPTPADAATATLSLPGTAGPSAAGGVDPDAGKATLSLPGDVTTEPVADVARATMSLEGESSAPA